MDIILGDEKVVSIVEIGTDLFQTEFPPRGKHVFFRDKMGVISNPFLGKREC